MQHADLWKETVWHDAQALQCAVYNVHQICSGLCDLNTLKSFTSHLTYDPSSGSQSIS